MRICVLDSEINGILDDVTSGVVWRLPREVGSLVRLADLDSGRSSREAWQTGFKCRHLAPRAAAAGVDTRNTKFVGGAGKQPEAGNVGVVRLE